MKSESPELLITGVDWPLEPLLLRKFEGLADAGFDITVAPLCAHTGLFSKLRQSRGKTENRHVGKLKVLPHLSSVADVRADLIHFENAFAVFNHLDLLAQLGVPFTVSLQNINTFVSLFEVQDDIVKEKLTRTFQAAKAVHYASQNMLDMSVQLGLDPSKATVIRPAVDTELFRPTHASTERDGRFRIAMIGQLTWCGGYEFALMAVRKLIDMGVDAEVTIIGIGEDRQRVAYTIQDLELADRVTLLGDQPIEQTVVMLQSSNVFLSSNMSIGIPDALIQAMACGLPVVTTDSGGVTEAVESGVEGFVTPLMDADAMAAGLRELARNEGARARMGAAARGRVHREFTLNQQIEKWVNFYLLAADPRKAAA
jgi:glycosyltransferase involved in cell wall biosynthesis